LKIVFGYQHQNWNWCLGRFQLHRSVSSPSKHLTPSKLFSLPCLYKSITSHKLSFLPYVNNSHLWLSMLFEHISCFLIYFRSLLLCWIYWSILKDISGVCKWGFSWPYHVHICLSNRKDKVPSFSLWMNSSNAFFGIIEQYHCYF